jgi:hypothetical protein
VVAVPKKRPSNAQSRGYEFEEKFAEALGAKPIKGSGSLWYAKLDIDGHGQVLFSLKHTDAQSFRVTKGLMAEAVREATGEQEAALAVSVDGEVFVVQRAAEWIEARKDKSKTAFIPQTKSEIKSKSARIPYMLREIAANDEK